MRRLLTFATLAFVLLCTPAAATITAVPEPPILKGTSNTYWFRWENPGVANYSLCYWVSVNNGAFARPSSLTCGGTGGDSGLLGGAAGYAGVTLPLF